MLNKRFFSHGCMRMEKPMDLGHLVLKNNRITINSLEQKACLRNQSSIIVHADEHMQVCMVQSGGHRFSEMGIVL